MNLNIYQFVLNFIYQNQNLFKIFIFLLANFKKYLLHIFITPMHIDFKLHFSFQSAINLFLNYYFNYLILEIVSYINNHHIFVNFNHQFIMLLIYNIFN